MRSIMKLWRNFWGNRYRVYKDDEKVAEVLIYNKKIYILSDTIE